MARRCACSPPDRHLRQPPQGRSARAHYAYVADDPEQSRFPFSEMRGLIVNEAGEIAARPFQKFLNWQEPGAAVTACPWNDGCEITTRMNGSLVYPARRASGELVWCTRSGPTDVAQLAVDFIENDLDDGEQQQMTAILQYTVCDDDGALCTPLFEFCSPDNRVVVRHDPRQPRAARRPPYPRRPVLAVPQDSRRLRQVRHRHRRTLRPAALGRLRGSEHPHPRGHDGASSDVRLGPRGPAGSPFTSPALGPVVFGGPRRLYLNAVPVDQLRPLRT